MTTATSSQDANPVMRVLLLSCGALLIAAAPLAAPLPGPGGTLIFAAGLVLVLRNSAWARRNFARWKRRWPRAGGFADWALRRRSAQRRRHRDKQRAN
jgi:hypothetical protein